MANLPVYLLSGFTRTARKRNFYETAVRKASVAAETGFNTRIPFVKKVLGIAALDGPSQNIKRFPLPLIEPGHLIACRGGMHSFEGFSAIHLAAQFNIDNAFYGGVQAVPVRGGYMIAAARVSHFGDLKIAFLDDSGLLGQGTHGIYEINIHEVFVAPHNSKVLLDSSLQHEIEHAKHFSLFHLAGYPSKWLSVQKAEYLAMLWTFFDGNLGILLCGDNPDSITDPYSGASRAFFRALKARHGFSKEELRRAVRLLDASATEDSPPDETVSYARRIGEAARAEYHEAYKRLFGLDLDDILEVVESLPDI